MKDLFLLRYFLGLEITRLNQSIVVNQHKYTFEFLVDTCLTVARSASTPIDQHLRLTTSEFDSTLGLNTNNSLLKDINYDDYFTLP